MRFPRTIPKPSAGNAVCAAATLLAGLLCLITEPLPSRFDRMSYDLPFVFAPGVSLREVVYIQRDERSYRELNQSYGQMWDRDLYVRLLDRLTADGARLAVFDIFLADPSVAEKDRKLAEAIRRNGRVVLAVDYHVYSGVEGGEPVYPLEDFKRSAAGLGLTMVVPDQADNVVRRIYPGSDRHPSLAWAAASLAGSKLPEGSDRTQTVRWMNYPSMADQLNRISFSEALIQRPGYFTNRIVFIGGAPKTRLEGDQVDQFGSPFSRLGGGSLPGAIIQMIAFLNLMKGTWLEQASVAATWLLVLGLGAIIGSALSCLRPVLIVLVAPALALIVFVGAAAGVFYAHRWFPWGIVVGVQVPVAAGCAGVLWLVRRFSRPPAALPPAEQDKPTVLQTPDPGAGPVSDETAALTAPDHELVRCIGQGAYGQVWLARDVIGNYHAIKFVFRKSFQDERPFDREFHGIQQFTPISRMHPGLVHVLHVGRNERAGHFFYIMELGDDEATGQQINPETYSPNTLGRVIRAQHRLPPQACIQTGMDLSSALAFLHDQGLIHRDIKPSNIVLVRGKPKLADIGLVTRVSTEGAHHTYIGTEGFIAPEGPGTPAADVYSLGMVLYEAGMGMDRMKFPTFPDAAAQEAEPLLAELKQVILKACEVNPRNRYGSAHELHEALRRLAGGTG